MRSRRLIALAAGAFVGLVCVVTFERDWPGWVRSSGGDVLIVVPIYCLAATACPRVRAVAIAAGTFALASIVECSQLYHGPAIDAFRATFIGRMTIGSTFVPSDFACYAIGVGFAYAFDKIVAGGRRAMPVRQGSPAGP